MPEENGNDQPVQSQGEGSWESGLNQLFRVTGAVTGSLEVSTVCEDALDPIASLVSARRVAIGVLHPESVDPANNYCEWIWGFQNSPGLEVEQLAEQGASSEPRGFATATELPPGAVHAQDELEGPVALAPLLVQGRLIGMILLERASGPFKELELQLLGNGARQLAAALHNSRLFTDLQQSYRKLINAQEQLIRSESQGAVGGLAATLAHEIRNPLATIISSLSQLRKHANLEGDAATLLEIAEEESLRLNRVITALLEFARPRMPRIEEMQPMAAIHEAVRLVRKNNDFPCDQEIELRGEPEDLEALADPDLFQRAVLHVVRNAMAAIKPASGRIEVHWCPLVGQDNSVVVTVRDNGCGIGTEYLSRVFEPFFSTKPSGIGLGLSVVRRIMEDHGGAVDIHSELGKGTDVRLIFPGHATTSVVEKEGPFWFGP